MANTPVHAERNQSEFPKSTRFSRYVRAIARSREALNWGRTMHPVPACTTLEGICSGPIPYHADHTGDIGVYRSFGVYAVQPVLQPLVGFGGEAFWGMQPFHPAQHPSGLDDWAFLRTQAPEGR